MSRRVVDTVVVTAIWCPVLSGVVLLGSNPDNDPTTDDVGAAVALGGLVGLGLTGIYLGVRRGKVASYLTGFVAPMVITWFVASSLIGGFGYSNANTRAGLIVWPTLFLSWLFLRRFLPNSLRAWRWQAVALVIAFVVGERGAELVTSNRYLSVLSAFGIWVVLNLARFAYEVLRPRADTIMTDDRLDSH